MLYRTHYILYNTTVCICTACFIINIQLLTTFNFPVTLTLVLMVEKGKRVGYATP